MPSLNDLVICLYPRRSIGNWLVSKTQKYGFSWRNWRTSNTSYIDWKFLNVIVAPGTRFVERARNSTCTVPAVVPSSVN